MKKKICLLIFIVIALFIYLQNTGSKTVYLNKAWENTMNASSGKITYTGIIKEQGTDASKLNNTKTIIDFMVKDNKFFYEKKITLFEIAHNYCVLWIFKYLIQKNYNDITTNERTLYNDL
ncbi:MAG: hypothetical protein Q4B86_04715 [Eubacteriales bacterium]|nr:hypothetical protein [Eubacteriales bacterium]